MSPLWGWEWATSGYWSPYELDYELVSEMFCWRFGTLSRPYFRTKLDPAHR